MDRFETTYSIQDVFQFVKENNGLVKPNKKDKTREKRAMLDGHLIKPYSLRYLNFIENGTDCICCGARGMFFAKERNRNVNGQPNTTGRYHLNLYAQNKEGHEVLMTKDHIIARAKGGADSVKNMMPLCTKCNNKKGTQDPKEWSKKHGVVVPEGEMRKMSFEEAISLGLMERVTDKKEVKRLIKDERDGIGGARTMEKFGYSTKS